MLFYCDGLLKATRETRVMPSTTELWLISSEGLNNHDKRGTTEDVS
jgi:hypothetical protein